MSSPSIFLFWYSVYRVLLSTPSILIWILHFGALWTYQLQMWIKMQHSIFKMRNDEENVINLANLLSLWSILWLLRGVDHKDRRLNEWITFSSLLLILNTLCCILKMKISFSWFARKIMNLDCRKLSKKLFYM